ncbi:hypothetical protein [Pseudoflavitalea rhizosphaerae]|uniref:hypothetical protein n=1 Tax=Pseudoflavitalea rhizosphaerae TaxID=1884793 RepID=UPI000F8D0F85|nr:hypothetical protein [Pseudoflavitalea rhizosphaerae]
MKIQSRIIYTSLLVIGCVLFAWPNTAGVVCDGQQSARASFIIRPDMEEEKTEKEEMNLIEPLMNLMPSCNLVIH